MRLALTAKILLLASMGLSLASTARAQGPDVRGTKPLMMMVVDTSGSMEWKPSCTCTTDSCDECLPDCDDDSGTDEKSRWAVALEALTGTFPDPFQCETYERNNSSRFGFDFGYSTPYHQPWQCDPEMSGPCNYNAPPDENGVPMVQAEDGILDQNKTEVRFGLMTFDSQPTYVGEDYLVSCESFDSDKSESEDGLWSYGMGEGYSRCNQREREDEDHTKVGILHFPNCTETFLMDTGARNQTASQGGLISALGTESMESTNEQIQNALLAVRPFGGTPMAAAMDDLYYYFDQLDDSYSNCRDTYAILITDGRPDDDYRAQSGCDCDSTTDCCMAFHQLDSCDGVSDLETNSDYNPSLFQCPYPTPVEVADALIRGYDGSGLGVLKECYVVGFATPCNAPPYCQENDTSCGESVTDPPWDPDHATEGCKVRDLLNEIAAACSRDGMGEAVFADALTDLQSKISGILNTVAAAPVSRTVPAFINTANTTGLAQYQFNTGFNVGSESEPWSGILERKRFQCQEGCIVEQTIENVDRFHLTLNDNTARKLWTALPATDSTCYYDGGDPHTCVPKDHLYRFHSQAACGQTSGEYCPRVFFENPTEVNQDSGVLRAHLDLPDTIPGYQERYRIMKWVHGDDYTNGADDALASREAHKLGDIYHSSPVAVGKPNFRLSDDEYGQFRYRRAVATRPSALYVGSNDGVLHAFSVDQYDQSTDNAHQMASYAAGEEMWGFIPPILLYKLKTSTTMHTFMVDGSPVIKDVPLSRVPDRVSCENANGEVDPFCNYRTVLVTGLRGGGNAYVALDVTDPVWEPGDDSVTDSEGNARPGPRFLWQFTNPRMGDTYGRPALGQVVVKWNPGTNQPDQTAAGRLMERAVAILPGGKGILELDSDGDPQQCDSMRNVYDSNNPFGTLSSDSVSDSNSHRHQVRCWETTGRAVFIVDVETGFLIKEIGPDVFPSPVVGTPALYQGDVGTLATRAFVADADGVIWRIDLSRPDPKPSAPLDGWTARPFHDVYWEFDPSANGYAIGQASYEAPVLSVDDQRRVVVLYATGDTENFENPSAQNYVVSLTETNTPSEEVTDLTLAGIKAAFNWEIRLQPSELVTGALELFNGRVYFSSFVAAPSYDPCDYGYSRLFAVDYVKPDMDRSWNNGVPTYFPELVPGEYLGDRPEDFNQPPLNNLNERPTNIPETMMNKLYMGVGIVRRPQCVVGTDETDFEDIYGQLGGLAGGAAGGNATYELVGMASGEAATGGSVLGSVRIQQAPPQQTNTVEAFAGTCE